MPTQPPPVPTPSPDEFRPENFTRKAGLRDYLIYLMLFVFVAGLVGATGYYLTRTEAEKKQILAKLRGITGNDETKVRTVQLRELNLDKLGEPAEATPAPQPEVTAPQVAASAYSGGRPSRVLPSEDPQRPAPGAEFVAFAEGLKVSGVFQGNPARAMLNGRMFRVGDEINLELAVTLVGVDTVKKFLVLRDKPGAELRLTY